MPLFEIVGFTSTWKTFPDACVLMSDEQTDAYDWILRMLKEMFDLVGKRPTIFVTDRELALMKALESQFPDTPHILCRRHILKDIEAKALTHMHAKGKATKFEWQCQRILTATTEEQYDAERARLQEEWGEHQDVINYVYNTWLKPYKMKIVRAWLDKITHFDSYTTNRLVVYKIFMKKC